MIVEVDLRLTSRAMRKMSERDQWFINADGAVNIDENIRIRSLSYFQKLNILAVTTESNGLLVYDALSWTLIKKSDIAGKTIFVSRHLTATYSK